MNTLINSSYQTQCMIGRVLTNVVEKDIASLNVMPSVIKSGVFENGVELELASTSSPLPSPPVKTITTMFLSRNPDFKQAFNAFLALADATTETRSRAIGGVKKFALASTAISVKPNRPKWKFP